MYIFRQIVNSNSSKKYQLDNDVQKLMFKIILVACFFMGATLFAGPKEDAILASVRELVDNSKFQEAVTLLNNKISREPKNEILISSLSDTYILLEKYDLAISTAKKAIAMNHKFSWPHTLLIKCYILTEKFNKAAYAIRDLRKLGATFDADFYTAEFYRAKGQHKKASFFYEKLLKTKNNQDYQEITAYNYTQGRYPYSAYRHLYEGYLQDKQNTKFVHALTNNLMMRSQFQKMEKTLNEHGKFCTKNKICDQKSQHIKDEYFHQKKPSRGVYFGKFGFSLLGAYQPELLSGENFIRYTRTNDLTESEIEDLPILGVLQRIRGAARLQFASPNFPRLYLDLDFKQLTEEDIAFSEFKNQSARLSMNLHYKIPLYGDILIQPWVSVREIDGVNGSLNTLSVSESSVTQIYSLGLDYSSSPNFYHSEISLKLAGSYGVNETSSDKFLLLDVGIGLRKLFWNHFLVALNGGFVGLRSSVTDYIDERLNAIGEVGVVFLGMFSLSAVHEMIWHFDDPKDLPVVFSHLGQSKLKFRYFNSWMTFDSEYFLFRGLNENSFDYDSVDSRLTFKIPIDTSRWYHHYKYTNRQFLDVSLFHKYIDNNQPHQITGDFEQAFGGEISIAW